MPRLVEVVLLLVVSLSGMSYANFGTPTSITFLAPKQKFHIDTSLKAVRVSFKVTTTVSKADIEKFFTDMETIIAGYKSLPYMMLGSSLAIKYRAAIQPGEGDLASAKDLFLHLYTFMEAGKEQLPQSNCSLIFQFFDPMDLSEGKLFLQNKQEELLGPLTADEVKNDPKKLMQLENFILAFNSITNAWYTQIHSIVAAMDVLEGLEFPEILRGRLETVSCLNNSNIAFETIKVISSTGITNGLIVELDVGYPAVMKEMVQLMPISYNGIALKGEAENVIFAREESSTEVQLLNCTSDLIYVHKKAPVCREIPLQEDCKTGLKLDDIDKILSYCTFTYTTSPMATRLLDDGILILGSDLTVTNYGKILYQQPPYILYTDSEVKIDNKGQELIFPALTTPKSVSILTTRLTMVQIVQLKTKAYYDTNFNDIVWADHYDLIALAIEILMIPLIAISFCIGIKNKMAQVQSSKNASRKIRKRNMRETRALLRESRL